MQRKLFRLSSFFCMIGAVFASHTSALAEESAEQPYRYPVVTAPLMSAAPTIDGTVDKAEWTTASQMSGLLVFRGQRAIEDRADVWIGYTADALHIAFRFERLPHAPRPKAGQDPMFAWSDDCAELLITPTPGRLPTYDFAVNSLGVGKEAWYNGSVSADKGLRIDWKKGARVVSDGWEGEVSIPFASLEKQTPQPGEQWNWLLARHRRTPSTETAVSSYLDTWHKREQFGVLRFGGRATPTTRILTAGAMTPTEAGAIVEVVAPYEEAAVKIDATLYRQTRRAVEKIMTHKGEILVPKEAELSVYKVMDSNGLTVALNNFEQIESWSVKQSIPAGQTKRIPLATSVLSGNLLLTYQISDANTNELLASRAFPFAQQPPLNVDVQKWLLVAKCLMIDAEYRRAGSISDGTRIVAELLNADDETVIDRVEAAAEPKLRRTQLRLPTEGRLGAKYRLKLSMVSKAGKTLNEVVKPLDLPKQPEWFGNTIGETDEVLPPWTPIELSGDKASVVLREYTFGENGLPSSIISKGEQLLGAPADLMLGGESLNWSRKLQSQKPGKVIWLSTATTSDARLSLKTTMEFDGMIRYDLTISPTGSEANLNNLELSLPYRSEFNIDPLVVSEAFDYRSMLGDYDRGLYWFCESHQGWQIGSLPVIEQTQADDSKVIDWRIRYIGAEGKTISKPLTYTWGLQALPVKDLQYDYQYTKRRIRGYDFMQLREPINEPDLTETDLRYPLKENFPVDRGSMWFFWVLEENAGLHTLAQIGEGEAAIKLIHARDRTVHRYTTTMQLKQGDNVIVELLPLDRSVVDPWMPIGLSWEKRGDKVHLEIVSTKPAGEVQMAQASISFADWQKAATGDELIFGSTGTMAVDELVISREFVNGPIMAAMFNRLPEPSQQYTLIDPMDDLRFYRARMMTRPTKITNGRGGIAGAKYSGSFVRMIEGRNGKAVVLPSNRNWSKLDWAKSFNGNHGVYHEQYHARHGHYNPSYAPDPLWAEALQKSLREGWGMAFYCGFGNKPEYDTVVGPFIDELAYRPTRTIYDNSLRLSMSKAAGDYFIWGWKKAIDEYGVYGQKSDNGLNCKMANKNIPLGFGWYDEEGKLQGRKPFFATRELAKRYYWLFHVYRKQKYGEAGQIMLHAGAAWYPFVAGFIDYRAHGESHHFMSADFSANPILPEDFQYGVLHHRYGVPVRILTKQRNMPYSPNYLYLYTHLYHMDLRNNIFQMMPRAWHWNEKDPYYKRSDEMAAYSPYSLGRPGVHSIPCPQGVSWMLKDEFGTQHAEFHPFWRNSESANLNSNRLYTSYWLHRGKEVLFVISNFDGKANEAELTVDLAKLGLADKQLRAYDAWTDDEYELNGNVVRLTIPPTEYRFVRLEPAY